MSVATPAAKHLYCLPILGTGRACCFFLDVAKTPFYTFSDDPLYRFCVLYSWRLCDQVISLFVGFFASTPHFLFTSPFSSLFVCSIYKCCSFIRPKFMITRSRAPNIKDYYHCGQVPAVLYKRIFLSLNIFPGASCSLIMTMAFNLALACLTATSTVILFLSVLCASFLASRGSCLDLSKRFLVLLGSHCLCFRTHSADRCLVAAMPGVMCLILMMIFSCLYTVWNLCSVCLLGFVVCY